MAKLSANFESW